jgi:hypothetical protein
MAEPGSWLAIRTNVLLSTRALLDLYNVDNDARAGIDGRRRPDAKGEAFTEEWRRNGTDPSVGP